MIKTTYEEYGPNGVQFTDIQTHEEKAEYELEISLHFIDSFLEKLFHIFRSQIPSHVSSTTKK